MKKSKSISLIVAAACIVLGLMIVFGVILYNGTDILSVLRSEVKETKHDITETVNSVVVSGYDSNIILSESSDEFCHIVIRCRTDDNSQYNVSAENGTLSISKNLSDNWYNHIGIDLSENSITIYLPDKSYDNLDAQNTSGDINIGESLKFKNAYIKTQSGRASFYADVETELSIDTSSGNASVNVPQSTADMRISVSSGRVSITGTDCKSLSVSTMSGDVGISGTTAAELAEIKTHSGSVKITDCDSKDFDITTTSGNVNGRLLSDKQYIVSTASGVVRVPDSVSENKCTVKTTSGNVTFK